MYLVSGDRAQCSGCTACEKICPKAAITMRQDERGFFYPVVDKALCVHCGLCEKVCRFHENKPWDNTVVAAYGMHHKDPSVHKASRSGGAFYMLAEKVIDLQGCVWGAAFDKDLDVVHIKVDSRDGLKKLQGSKYVQSQLQNSFPVIMNDLKAGKWVLFSGTACQVAGLLGFLELKNCSTDKLITCDIVCQGVPSPGLYRDYRAYLEQKHGAKLAEFNFRDAGRIGWKGHEESYRLENKNKKYFSRKYAKYYYCYYMRESCFACKYTGLHRPADFTLGDFWGVEEHYPAIAKANGTSLILINTEKGRAFFEEARKTGKVTRVDVENCLQPRLCSPSKKPQGYDIFWEDYKTKGYKWCIEHYGTESPKSKLVYTIKPLLTWNAKLNGVYYKMRGMLYRGMRER